jgi:hypothetical protein
MTESIDSNHLTGGSVTEFTQAPELPVQVLHFLKAIVVLFCIAIVVIPELPKEFFIAHHPISHQPYFFLRSHVFAAQFYLLWAFIGFFSIVLPIRIGIVGVILLLTFVPVSLPNGKRLSLISEKMKSKFWLLIIITGLLSTCFFYLAKTSFVNNMSFADVATLPGFIEQGVIFPAEVLTCYFFQIIQLLVSVAIPTFESLDAIILANCIAGGIFVVCVLILVRSLSRGVVNNALLVIGIIGSGYVLTFFGYVETTELELVSMAGFFASALRANVQESQEKKNFWEVIALIFASLAFMVHAAGILLLPAVILMLMRSFDGKWKSFINGLSSLVTPRNLVLIFVILLLPYYLLIGKPFYLHGDFGNASGGADNIMFVPLHMDYANPPSKFVYYSMFSTWHFFDILCTMLLACPFTIPLLISSLYLTRRYRILFTIIEKRLFWITGSGAFFCMLVPLFWNHDFGMWGDWNIAVTYWFPANLFGWIVFHAVLQRFSLTTNRAFQVLIPTILTQAVLCLGMLWQLY